MEFVILFVKVRNGVEVTRGPILTTPRFQNPSDSRTLHR